MRKSIGRLLLCALFFFPWSAQAAIISMTAEIDTLQATTLLEPSDGAGAAGITFNTSTRELGWVISFENLTGPATAAHFHGPAAVGATAGVQVNVGAGPGVLVSALGSDAGSFIGTATLSEAQANDLLSDLWYVNIHTEMSPGGEIRGQVFRAEPAPIPLPGAVWMFAPALGWVGLLARRRKARE